MTLTSTLSRKDKEDGQGADLVQQIDKMIQYIFGVKQHTFLATYSKLWHFFIENHFRATKLLWERRVPSSLGVRNVKLRIHK